MKTLFYRLIAKGGTGITLSNDGATTTNVLKGAKIAQTRTEFKKLVRKLKKNGTFTAEKL